MQVSFDLGRDLYSRLRVSRRRMRNRDDSHKRLVGDDLARNHHYARPVFAAFFLSTTVLTRPQIGIADDEARVRIG